MNQRLQCSLGGHGSSLSIWRSSYWPSIYIVMPNEWWLHAVLARQSSDGEEGQELRTNQMNMSFFANIAHEFRTPLTMIAGSVGQLAKSETLLMAKSVAC